MRRHRKIGKEERERWLVREFLDHAGIPYRPQGVRSVGGAASGPDVKVTCLAGGGPKRVGIEITEYQVDAGPNGSAGRRMHSFHDRVWRRLWELLEGAPELSRFFGSLWYDWSVNPFPHHAEPLAKEVVRFLDLNRHTLRDGKMRRLRRKTGPNQGGDFDGFPMMARYLSDVLVQYLRDCRGPFMWQYNNAACVSIDEQIILRTLARKAKALPTYAKKGIEELWLLVCAGVLISHDSAGPEEHARHKLAGSTVLSAARSSGFDRVTFWSRHPAWHIDLWPRP